MELPDMIASLFAGIREGVLVPVLNGIYDLGVPLLVIVIIALLVVVAVTRRPGPIVASIIVACVIAYLWYRIPDIVSALMNYDLGPGVGSASDFVPTPGADALDELG